ncbi:MAG TPA: alcohol dehydrogenase catalytic domain-containing protein, partial [Thermoanaerobaculia bacterium]|nr:alcohol dehydrogenase catalytic domain-containing protein [Thermoanaerobaculia bacterium]
MPQPRPRPGFALVRVIASGICNTDLELRRGYHDFSGIPGHEFVGRVEG